MDVYSFGNNIYALLTGLWPFHDVKDNGEVQQRIKDGELPFVDSRFEDGSYAEQKLVQVLQRCWIYNPADRADIFEVVALLKEGVEANNKIQR